MQTGVGPYVQEEERRRRADAFEEQLLRADYNDLSFDERLGFLVEREHFVRANRQLTYRLQRPAQTQCHHPAAGKQSESTSGAVAGKTSISVRLAVSINPSSMNSRAAAL
jgi:hypothetical protein